MASYARVRTILEHSEASDYSNPTLIEEFTSTATPTKKLAIEISAATGGTTVETGTFTTISHCVIENEDATNFVEVEFDYDSATRKVKVVADSHTVLQALDPTADITITADTAACVCEVWLFGT